MTRQLRVLVVDDMPKALERLYRLLEEELAVGEIRSAADPMTALRIIDREHFDVVFLDISMPGLSGTELASLLGKLKTPPKVVFVTAYDEHAVEAFELDAVDYLLKPVRPERLTAALTKVLRSMPPTEAASRADSIDAMTAVPVDSDGVTSLVRRRDVLFVEAQRDYVKLHTRSGVHAVKMPLTRFVDLWEGAGFLQVHRSYLVAVAAITELRTDTTGGLLACTNAGNVPVSRRHARDLKYRFLRAVDPPVVDER